jgi:hypothetical protein
MGDSYMVGLTLVLTNVEDEPLPPVSVGLRMGKSFLLLFGPGYGRINAVSERLINISPDLHRYCGAKRHPLCEVHRWLYIFTDE